MDNINIDIIENIEDVSVAITEMIEEISIVTSGTRGDPGAGFPIGGSGSQVLTKLSSNDYDTAWITPKQYVYSATDSAFFPMVGDINTLYVDTTEHISYIWDAAEYVAVGGLGNKPVGLDKEVEFNDNGVRGSDANFLFDNVTKSLIVGKAVLLPDNPLGVGGDVDSYLQVNIQNKNNGIHASSDFVATANDGDDENFYIDFGINGSNYNDPEFPYAGAHDGYFLSVGGDLTVAAVEPDKEINFYAGSWTASAVKINGSGVILETGNTYKIGNFNVTDLIVSVSGSQAEADAFALGSKLVIRTDLL